MGGSRRDYLLEAFAIAGEIGSKPPVNVRSRSRQGSACCARNGTRATGYFGSAEAQMALTDLKRDPSDDAFLTPLITRRARRWDPTFARPESAGRAMGYDQAIADARAWLTGQR